MNPVGKREDRRKLNAVLLMDAVLCVDCETVSNSPHDQCLVCGSTSLLNLHRLLDGTLPHQSRASEKVRYNLEIVARVNGMTADDLNHTAESISRVLNGKASGDWDSFHINVKPVLAKEKEEKDASLAA